MKKVTAASIALAMMTSTSAIAQEVKHDTKIAKAAAAKAAEKIGDIRETINYEQVPDLVTKEDMNDKAVNTSFLPNISEQKQNSLPPLTSLVPELDMTVTGSIDGKKVVQKTIIIWDKFDRYGNPIK